jgi:hypothetical protein
LWRATSIPDPIYGGVGDASPGRLISVEEAMQFRVDRLKMLVTASFQIPPKSDLVLVQARRLRQ